ncbi:hypothetical protein JFU47_32095 [Pseudomonas sp. TH39(2020)]|uniref:hypothetical protein n=1 Tax=Pseudomonas sp. TH39(2020) TaxID=2796349 RepID=UPI0019117A7B|nr:hypothetical protein [Pseudomonas sp. TH39(2020)]MBK5401319.1 hypothetical protein [Pseudomonas sp. TH39(2020)]
MSPKLQLLERKFNRQNPEAPAPEGHGLGVAIESLIADEVERRVGEAVERKPPPRVRDLFNAPAPYTDFKQIPPTPRHKTPPPFESVVSQRDAFGRIAKMTTKPLQGDGPTFETAVMQRDENGRIVRAVTSVVDTALPGTPR